MVEEKLLSVSWSKLRAFAECRQKAHLQSTGARSPAGDTRVFFRGTVTDRVLRDWIQNKDRQPGQMESQVDEYIELCEKEHRDQGTGIVRWKHPDDKSESSLWCKELLRRVEPIVEKLVLPYAPDIFADHHLRSRITIPGLDGEDRVIELVGIMDLYVRAPGFSAIYDLKATENESYWKKTIMQLAFYYLLVTSYGDPAPDEVALIQPMCANPIIGLTVTDEMLDALMTNVVNYAHSVWAEDFTPKTSDAGCSWCPVKHACVKFKADEKGRLSWT